jgi:hypothetical protein
MSKDKSDRSGAGAPQGGGPGTSGPSKAMAMAIPKAPITTKTKPEIHHW